MEKIANILIVGAGNIGTAMARGIVRAGVPVNVYNRSAARLEQFAGDASVRTGTDLAGMVRTLAPDLIVICTEGPAVPDVIDEMGPELKALSPVVLSCAAVPTLASLEEWLSPYLTSPRIVRLLPTIAAVEGASANLVCSRNVSADTLAALKELFAATGSWHEIPEADFAAAMALTSCGIAFALRYIRAAAEGGVELGLSPKLATALAASALGGAVAMLEGSGEHPEMLVDRVTTPGGLTIKGLNTMEAAGLSAAVIAGIKAASKHS